MDLNVRVAFQNEVWTRYKITVSNFERLLGAYLKRTGKAEPINLDAIRTFLTDGFSIYLEPISGFVCSRKYSKSELEKAGVQLVEIGPGPSGFYKSYQDKNSATYWSDVEGRYGEVVGSEFLLLGKDKIEDLQIS